MTVENDGATLVCRDLDEVVVVTTVLQQLQLRDLRLALRGHVVNSMSKKGVRHVGSATSAAPRRCFAHAAKAASALRSLTPTCFRSWSSPTSATAVRHSADAARHPAACSATPRAGASRGAGAFVCGASTGGGGVGAAARAVAAGPRPQTTPS